jgi:hypothetical protein
MSIKPREFSPKRGIPNTVMTLNPEKIEFKSHHQKALILSLLNEAEGKSMGLKEMIEKVEGNESLWSLLNSKQSVFHCITFHMKDLEKIKVLTLK